MESVDDFMSKFYSLKEIKLGEKYRKFFLLLNDYRTVNEAIIDGIISTLTPRNHLECIFKIETLLFFKRTRDLIEVLKNENINYSKRILRQRWFFQQPFETISAKSVVTELLPNFSVITRNKILRNLAKYHKNEIKLDEIFDELLKKYGTQTATLVLTGCSAEKIEQVLANHTLKLSSKQVKIIFNKSNKLLEIGMENTNIITVSESDGDKIIQYLALKKPTLDFVGKPYLRIGKRTTRKVLVHSKRQIMENPEEYLNNIHNKTISKSLNKEELHTVLRNLCPPVPNFCSYYRISHIMRHRQTGDPYKTFREMFEEVYNKNLFDHVDCMPEELVESVSDTEEREKWIAAKLKEGVTDTRYIHCYEINKAISMIKAKLNLTSTYRTREVLIEKLVETCEFYKDTEMLLEVLKYVCKRHRNDDVLKVFVSHLIYLFDISQLSEDHWKCIQEIVEVIKLKSVRFGLDTRISVKYLEYLWKNNQPIEETLKELMAREDFSTILCKLSDKKLEKAILFLLIKLTPETAKNEIVLRKCDFQTVSLIINWNRKNKEEQISVCEHPRLITSLKAIINEKCEESLQNIFEYFTYETEHNEFREFMIAKFFQSGLNVSEKINQKKLLNFLKVDPLTCSLYINNIIEFLFRKVKHTSLFWSYIKLLNDYPFYERTVKYCLENYEKRDVNVNCILSVLAYFMPVGDYLNLVAKYIPSAEKMDYGDDNSYIYIFKLEEAVVKSFKYTRSVLVVPTIFKFFRDDHLKSALETLYYYFHHSAKINLNSFLHDLSSRTDRLRKHTFLLTCELGNVEDIEHTYRSVNNTEKDITIRRAALKKVVRYFRKNPTDRLFDLIIPEIKSLKKSDNKILNVYKKLSDISLHHRIKFFMYLVDNLPSCNNEDSVIPDLTESFLEIGVKIHEIARRDKEKILKFFIEHFSSHTNKTCVNSEVVNKFLGLINGTFMKDLPGEICHEFINTFYLESNDYILENHINSFVRQYVLHCPSDLLSKLTFINNRVVEFQKKNPSDLHAARKSRQQFSVLACTVCDDLKCKDVDCLKSFLESWLKMFSKFEFSYVYCYLHILIIDKEAADIQAYAVKLHDFSEEIISSGLGPCFIHIIAEITKQFVDNDEKLYSLCRCLYKINQSVSNCDLILALFPKKILKEKGNDETISFLKLFGCHPDPTVRLSFNMFMLEC